MRPDYRQSDTAEALILIWEIRKTWHCAHQILLIIQMFWSPQIQKILAKWKKKWICLEVNVWQHCPTLPWHPYKICLKVSIRAWNAVVCIRLRRRPLHGVLIDSVRHTTCSKSYQTIKQVLLRSLTKEVCIFLRRQKWYKKELDVHWKLLRGF